MANDLVPHSLLPPIEGRQFPVQVHAGDRDVVVVVVGVPVFPRTGRAIEPLRGRAAYRLPAIGKRRTGWRWALLAPVLLVPALLAGWALATFTPAQDNGFALRIPLPAPYMREPTVPKLAPMREAAPDPARAAAVPAPVTTGQSGEVPPRALLAIDRMPQVEAAMRKALRSGVAEPWAARGLKGFAIAGPVQIEDNNACRILAVWAEADGSAGKPISSLRCLSDNGQWITPPEGAAARFAAAARAASAAMPATGRGSPAADPAPARPDGS